MIKIRPHHILCIFQFRGYGYSEEFVDNMYKIINNIENEKIKIVTECDDICKKCPNISNQNFCSENNENILNLDNSVISLLNLNLNNFDYFYQLKEYLKLNLNGEIFEKICGNCDWYKKGFCKFENFNL